MSELRQPNRPSPPSSRWIRTPEGLRALAATLVGGRVIALDSESDSLHSFPEKVCLVQLADEAGAVSLVDPLAVRDLSPLASILADPAVVKVFHGASYDVSTMKRDFGFEIAGLFDTMVGAQFLGLPELGLASLLERFFGIPPGPSRQKDDWARRPLTPEQEAYAVEDVRHLIPLRERLLLDLRSRGREAWVQEECSALAAIPAARRVFDPDQYLHMKGAKDLNGRGLAALRELFVAREAWAQEDGRPPFKVLGNEAIVGIAAGSPRTPQDLRRIPGCSPKVIQRYGDRILAAIARAERTPQAELPAYPRPKKPRVPPAVQRRIEGLTRWRGATAVRLELDPGLVLPRRLIEQLAEQNPVDQQALGRVEGLRRWRIESFGAGMLEVLAAGPREQTRRARTAGGERGGMRSLRDTGGSSEDRKKESGE